MQLDTIINESTFQSLDEKYHELYQQNSETKDYYLDLVTGAAEKVAVGLISERDKLAANNKKLLTEKIQAMEKAAEAEAAAEAAGNKGDNADPAIAEKYQSELEKIKSSFDQEREALKTRESAMQQQLATTVQKQTIASLVNEYGLNAEDAPFVLDHYIRSETDDSGAVNVVVYENGEKALVAGAPKTPKQLVDGFISNGKHKSIFTAQNGGGSGAPANQQGRNGGSKTMTRSDFDRMATENPMRVKEFMGEGGKVIDN